jgi:hypothetical protein
MEVVRVARLELSGNNHALIGQHGFAGDASLRVTLQKGIQDTVRDAVGKFVGVPFRNGFRREEAIANCHCQSPFGGVWLVI